MNLDLEILVPDGVVVHTEVEGVQAADASGRFGLWPGHQAFVTLLTPCVLLYREVGGRERYAAADGGVLLVNGKQVSVVTREAVVADRLEDVADTVTAMLRARRIDEQTARAEFAELQFALLRELRQVEQRP
jgi:F-type H+-transporting ATPase subunit epsilon